MGAIKKQEAKMTKNITKTRFKQPHLKKYGSNISVLLSKKSSPGDGMFANGVKGMFG